MLSPEVKALLDITGVQKCGIEPTINGYTPLVERYHGLGHALVLCQDSDGEKYFLWILGGSCGQEAEYNHHEFMNLTPGQIKWLTEAEAVAEFRNYQA
jgi:hypothetical protein